ncbi:MAG: glycosyltransferase family 39 protein [Anaerolineaceae bacterium]|nr:glycosyltransferase family 39 protein [Anaerolineaceae bacterium]
MAELLTPRQERWLIGLLLVIMLVKGALWSLAFPLWQGPDEDDHYAVIQFIGENGRLPDEADVWLPDEVALSRELADVGRLDYNPEQRQGWSDQPVGLREAEFDSLPLASRTSTQTQITAKLMHATPLYYLLAAIPYRLVGYEENLLVRMQVQRLFAVLLSSPIVLVAYLTARLLFPNNQAMQLTVPILVTFHPQLTQMTAVISVDGFFFVLYALLIYLCLRVLRDGLGVTTAVFIGLTFAAAFLIKPTINGFVPLVALVVVYDWWRRKGARWPVVWAAVVMNVIILPPAAWWMARSWRLNHDLFYFNPVVEGHRIIQNPFYEYQFLPHMLDYYQSVWGGLFVTWWAHFGWVDTPLPPWVYHLLRVLTVLAIAGLAWKLGRGWAKRPSFPQWQNGQRMAPLVVWLFLALTILVPVLLLQVYDLTFWWEYGNGRGLQGRYWLGTVVPMLTFFTLGLLFWLPQRWHPAAHWLLRLGMVLFNFVALLGYILPRYYL